MVYLLCQSDPIHSDVDYFTRTEAILTLTNSLLILEV